jgi:hypothetical protein
MLYVVSVTLSALLEAVCHHPHATRNELPAIAALHRSFFFPIGQHAIPRTGLDWAESDRLVVDTPQKSFRWLRNFLRKVLKPRPRHGNPNPNFAMDASLYKTHTTSRGLVYRYWYAAASAGKRTLFFLHGFPSTSHDWRHQANFFRAHGYGVLVPDMLGYGGTAKPLETDAYKPSLICRDLVDLLDAEGIPRAVFVSHDW